MSAFKPHAMLDARFWGRGALSQGQVIVLAVLCTLLWSCISPEQRQKREDERIAAEAAERAERARQSSVRMAEALAKADAEKAREAVKRAIPGASISGRVSPKNFAMRPAVCGTVSSPDYAGPFIGTHSTVYVLRWEGGQAMQSGSPDVELRYMSHEEMASQWYSACFTWQTRASSKYPCDYANNLAWCPRPSRRR